MTYTYEVICGDGQVRTPESDQSFQIRTACRPGESFSFAVYGDTRPSENKTTRYHEAVINQAVLNEPLFCLVLGDMVDDGSRIDLWEEFFRVESRLLRRCAIYPVFGDNDVAEGKGLHTEFFPDFARGYYKFEWGGVQFFGLLAWDATGEQGAEEIDSQSPQVKWLEAELSKQEAQEAPFRVVFMHDPVYISRGRTSETLSRALAPVFKKCKVDVVFSSWHLYERSVNEEITYIISGGAGAELIWMNKDPSYPSQADAKEYHFCKVDINAGSMTISAVGINGTVFDSVTLTPKSHQPEAASRVERAAKRLGKEIFINASIDSPAVPMYFFSSDCEFCRELLNNELPRLANENDVSFAITYFDLGEEGTYDLFLNAATEFGRQGADIPAILIGRSVLGGESEIRQNLPVELAQFRKDPQSYLENMITPFTSSHDTAAIKEEQLNKLSFGKVFAAGLTDGFKPCAMTTVIFLIAYLILIGGSRRQTLLLGGTFVFAVFSCLMILGLAFFNFSRIVLKDPTVAIIINIVLLLFVTLLGLFSIMDLVKSLKEGNGNAALRLPELRNIEIRKLISYFAENKIAVFVTFAIGLVLTSTVLVCTGQIYLPIVNMISDARTRIMATEYLFCYNLAFIVPLLIAFLIAGIVFTSKQLRAICVKNVAFTKLLTALLFVAMAILIIFNLRWL